jgi:hypothetical protein
MSTINFDDITAVDWSPKVGAIGEVVEDWDDIAQCLGIILKTPKGSDPHRPEFGSDCYDYIDWPVTESIPNIIRAAIDAINIWEPRIKISGITATTEESQISLTIQWQLKGQDVVQTPIEVTL